MSCPVDGWKWRASLNRKLSVWREVFAYRHIWSRTNCVALMTKSNLSFLPLPDMYQEPIFSGGVEADKARASQSNTIEQEYYLSSSQATYSKAG